MVTRHNVYEKGGYHTIGFWLVISLDCFSREFRIVPGLPGFTMAPNKYQIMTLPWEPRNDSVSDRFTQKHHKTGFFIQFYRLKQVWMNCVLFFPDSLTDSNKCFVIWHPVFQRFVFTSLETKVACRNFKKPFLSLLTEIWVVYQRVGYPPSPSMNIVSRHWNIYIYI